MNFHWVKQIRKTAAAIVVTLVLAPSLTIQSAHAHDFGGSSGAGSGDGGDGGPGGGAGGPGGDGGSGGPGGGDGGDGGGGGGGPQEPGNPNEEGSPDREGRPVVFFSGSETVDGADLVIKGAFPLVVRRQYDSRSDYDSALGHGWAFEFDRRLYEHPDNSVVVRYSCGVKDKYVYAGGSYVTPAGVGRLSSLAEFPHREARRNI